MEDTLVEVRSTAARAIADKKEITRKLDGLETEAREWEAKAELALDKGREDLAKAALAEKAASLKSADGLRAQQVALSEGLEKLNDDIASLEEKLKLAGHSGPSFRRTYSGGIRMPPLFSTIPPTDPERNKRADEWPKFKKGVWRFDIQAGARSRILEQCQRPVDQLRTMMRVYSDGYACEWGGVKSIAGGATAQARNCRGTGSNGEVIKLTANMRINVLGADNFVAELRMGAVKEQLNARRISDCPASPSPNELPS